MSVGSGELIDWLIKDRARNQVAVTSRNDGRARECRLKYRVLDKCLQQTLVQIRPLTGRSHQIRVQLAHLGFPVVGDLRYGAKTPLGSRIMLHAARLEFMHPTLRTDIAVECQMPDTFGR